MVWSHSLEASWLLKQEDCGLLVTFIKRKLYVQQYQRN